MTSSVGECIPQFGDHMFYQQVASLSNFMLKVCRDCSFWCETMFCAADGGLCIKEYRLVKPKRSLHSVTGTH